MTRQHQLQVSRRSPGIRAAALAIAMLAAAGAAQGQQAGVKERLGAIKEGIGKLKGRTGSFVDEYMFGRIGAEALFGDPVSHRFLAARLGIDYPLGGDAGTGRIYIEGGYAHRSASLKQKRSNDTELVWDPGAGSYTSRPSELPESRELDVSTSEVALREAYLELEPAENLSLAFGYQRPIWGQFDIVSPVNLLLPLEFQSEDLSYSKAAYRTPQPTVSATMFPHERLELGGYWFFGTELDPLHEEILEEADGDTEVYVAGTYGATETRARPREDVNGYKAHALRGVWYGDSLTFGVTYYKGRNTLFAFDELPLVEHVRQTRAANGNTRQFDAYSVIERSVLPTSQALGLEISVPVGRWTWKGEAFHMSTQADIGGLRRENIASGAMDVRSRAIRSLYEWTVDENGGRGYVDVDLVMAGAGFDALYDDWRFGTSVFAVGTRLGDKAKEAEQLAETAYSDDDAVGTSTTLLPNAYVIRDFNDERTRSAGLVGGFAGPFFGLSAFFTSTWLDGWRWTASVEYATALGDQLLDELNSESGAYEIEEDASLGVGIGLLYEF